MFGDIGLVFNPKTAATRASREAGEDPLSGVTIPIATDERRRAGIRHGLLKVTPRHDANDFDIANRAGPKERSR